MSKLVVVTASANERRFENFRVALEYHARNRYTPIVVVGQGIAPVGMRNGIIDYVGDYLGVVPAFARGVEVALRAYPEAEVIACLHDDVLLSEPNWDEQILAHFQVFPECGLAGFGGAWGLGDEQAGRGEYRPTWLVRRGFMSNMKDAEVHGTREVIPRKVAVLDGFSLVFRRAFLQQWLSAAAIRNHRHAHTPNLYPGGQYSLFSLLQSWGVVHHAYDAAMGAFAKDLGWETWLLPFACHHLGGQTAVGDGNYQAWALKQRPSGMTAGGDQKFWEEAHRIVWQRLGHLLPFEVERP